MRDVDLVDAGYLALSLGGVIDPGACVRDTSLTGTRTEGVARPFRPGGGTPGRVVGDEARAAWLLVGSAARVEEAPS